jgi:hypothetical protein
MNIMIKGVHNSVKIYLNSVQSISLSNERSVPLKRVLISMGDLLLNTLLSYWLIQSL